MAYLIRIGAICAVVFALVYSFLMFYIVKNSENDKKKKADVILVLGAKSYKGEHYNPCLVSRVEHAVDLYKQHYAPKLILSGGNDKEDQVNEAETMKKIALSLGVPEQDILLEPASTSTYENLVFSQKILDAEHLKSIILVTEAFHAPRADLVAQKLGLDAVSSPATQSICWTKHRYCSRYLLKEPLAIMFYKVKGKV